METVNSGLIDRNQHEWREKAHTPKKKIYMYKGGKKNKTTALAFFIFLSYWCVRYHYKYSISSG